MSRPEIYCEYCGKGPLANKGSLKSHIRYRCKKAPPEAQPPTLSENDAPEEDTYTPPPPVAPPVGQRSAPPPAMSAADLAGLPPDEMERRIQALVDARVRAAMSTVEERLGSLMESSVSMIEETCNRLPNLVERQVQGMLGGGSDQVVLDEAGHQVNQPAPAPRATAAAGLGGILTPELLSLAAKLLGAEGEDIASIIAAVVKKQQSTKKRAEPMNAAMMTRGAGHMIAWIKNKKVDPMALARVTITEADEIMKMPGIDNSTKSYWVGRKGEAANYLAALMLEKEGEEQESGPAPSTAPLVPAPAPRKRRAGGI